MSISKKDRAQRRSRQRLRHENRRPPHREPAAAGQRRRVQAKGNIKQYGTKIKDALKR